MLKTNETKLLSEQKSIYDKIMYALSLQKGCFFFLFTRDGTGKTYLISSILAGIRSKRNMAVAVASIVITAILLNGARTFFFSISSVIKFPMNTQTNENAT